MAASTPFPGRGTVSHVRSFTTGESSDQANLLALVAASDDFLLGEAVDEAVRKACAELDDPTVETMPQNASPEYVAVEMNSPSLFATTRVLLAPDVRAWVKAPAPRDAPPVAADSDVSALVRALEDDVPEGTALIMGAWCGGQPKGDLVNAVKAHGTVTWIATPEPPKPWEDGAVSDAQRAVLRGVITRAAPGVRFAPGAEHLLLERLGFAPRRLSQESAKLAAAAGPSGTVDEALVRSLVLPQEGSIEVLQEAILDRNATAAAAFLDDARRGIPVRDWSGARISERELGLRVFNLMADTMTRMLYLRHAAAEIGAEAELDPQRCRERAWYSRTFKTRLAPALQSHIEADVGAPFAGRSKVPKPWALHLLFRGASRYRRGELVTALIASGADRTPSPPPRQPRRRPAGVDTQDVDALRRRLGPCQSTSFQSRSRSSSTIFLTSWARSIGATSTASPVATTIRSSTPATATTGPSLTTTLRAESTSQDPPTGHIAALVSSADLPESRP